MPRSKDDKGCKKDKSVAAGSKDDMVHKKGAHAEHAKKVSLSSGSGGWSRIRPQ